MKKVKVSVPATVANLVCGFDILGMALQAPCDTMELQLLDEPVIRIRHTDAFGLPEQPEHNVAGPALRALLQDYGQPIGFELNVHKTIKPGSGLGSSAAGSAGAVVAANYLLNGHFSKPDLVRFAMQGEKLATGVKHADNIAPCIYGGVTLIRSIYPLDIVALEAPDLFVTIVHPLIEVKTADARQILRKEVQLKDAIRQWGNIAGLVTGLAQRLFTDQPLARRCDHRTRAQYPDSLFSDIKNGARDCGALGGGISGSGPSVFMLSEKETTARAVEKMMQEVYTKTGIEFNTYVTAINPAGVVIENP